MSLFGLKFSQMILHTETSKLMYNWSFLFVVLHKPTLLPSTFNLFQTKELWHYTVYLNQGGVRSLSHLPAWTASGRHILAIFLRDKATWSSSHHLLCCSDIKYCTGLPMHIYQMKNGHTPTDFLMRTLGLKKGLLAIMNEQTLERAQEGPGTALEPLWYEKK